MLPTKHEPIPSAERPKRAAKSDLARFLTPDEVADLLRTSRRAIYAQIRRGTLPGVVHLSRRLLVDRDVLLHWLDTRRAVSLTTQGVQR
jgi:excisionase family DNA binding protein